MDRVRVGLLLLVILFTAGCGDGAAGSNNAATANDLAAEAPQDAAVLAQDPELANDAAADEAADMEAFGGNAAAMDGNRQ